MRILPVTLKKPVNVFEAILTHPKGCDGAFFVELLM